MKKLFLFVTTSVILFSVFTVFSKPNPNSSTSFNQYGADSYGKALIPSPEVVKARLEALPCEIEMKYNSTVQSDIEKYLKYGRKQLSDLLVRASYYLPIFEKALKEAGLPDELKYLPVIESNLQARVTSNRGAGGLWQFMPIAAKGYDMKISSTIDERCDPYISSERACRMLKDLYAMFGDWSLALAAYNAGPGTVQRAMKRAGAEKGNCDFWSIYNYLPAQTRNYVPKFIAMNYIMNYYTEHNISEVPDSAIISADTLHITEKVHFSQIAGVLDVSLSELRSLNPHLRADMTQPSAERPCTLILPAEQVQQYKDLQDQIRAFRKTNTSVTASTATKKSSKSLKKRR